MKIAEFYKRYENWILAAAVVLGMAVFVGVNFDYYYQANDDVYIKNILSGVYTGTPESHNIQMHYPISLLLSLIYRLAGVLPVYGGFLSLCHYGSLFLILERSLFLVKKRPAKIVTALLLGALGVALLLPELVFMQYTVTCTMLACAGVFRFYLTDTAMSPARYIRANIGNILLVVLAFLVRSEMLLLVLPLICTAGFFKWMSEKPIFTKQNAIRFLTVFGLILLGLGIGQGVHSLAYAGEDWKTFTRFFDERTQLYDYQFIPSYEENEEFYEGIGLLKSEQELLVNYNFGLDDRIDSEILRKTAAYAEEQKTSDVSFRTRFRSAFFDYAYKTRYGDYPWNFLVVLAYALLFLLAWKNKSGSFFWKIPCLLFVRSGLWMYIIMGNRYPDRITHSLYLMELVILGALLFEQCLKEGQKKKVRWQGFTFTAAVFLFLGLAAAAVLPDSLEKVGQETELRDYANEEIQALDAYCRKNAENFYLVDVYSAVSCQDMDFSGQAVEYSEKAFRNVDNSLANYDIMGGWVCKSPLMEKKLSRFGLEADFEQGRSAMAAGLLDRENVYVIIKADRELSWLSDYYKEIHGIRIRAEEADVISAHGKNVYIVYRIEEES